MYSFAASRCTVYPHSWCHRSVLCMIQYWPGGHFKRSSSFYYLGYQWRLVRGLRRPLIGVYLYLVEFSAPPCDQKSATCCAVGRSARLVNQLHGLPSQMQFQFNLLLPEFLLSSFSKPLPKIGSFRLPSHSRDFYRFFLMIPSKIKILALCRKF